MTKSVLSTNKEMIFECAYEGVKSEYKYTWDSTAQMGLATLKRNGKMIYEPYLRTSPEGYTMAEVARRLSIEALRSFIPPEPPKQS